MTDLQPSDLTAEERAIVDRIALEFSEAHQNETASTSYSAGWSMALQFILARRALFAPEKEEKVLPCGCVLCTCEDEVQCHGCGAKLCETHRKTMLAAPAPPAEMPEAVSNAAMKLRHSARYCERDGYPSTASEEREIADALESWWHSQNEMTMQGMIDYQDATSDYYAMKRRVEELEAQPAPAKEEKVPCPNCGAAVEQPWAHYPGGWRCPTLPAQPEAPGLLEAVQRISDSIGWRSTQGDDPTLYYCEFCSEAHPDWRNVPHHDECPVFVIRAAIAKATTPMSNKPAQPEPAPPSEMPEAVREAARILRVASKGYVGFTTSFLGGKADAIESWWRSQPAPAVAMSDEEIGELASEAAINRGFHGHCALDFEEGYCAAVRAQASQPQGVKLPKVREALITLSGCIYMQENMDKVIAALAELDAHEGN